MYPLFSLILGTNAILYILHELNFCKVLPITNLILLFKLPQIIKFSLHEDDLTFCIIQLSSYNISLFNISVV
jgi:hypothetical protein